MSQRTAKNDSLFNNASAANTNLPATLNFGTGNSSGVAPFQSPAPNAFGGIFNPTPTPGQSSMTFNVPNAGPAFSTPSFPVQSFTAHGNFQTSGSVFGNNQFALSSSRSVFAGISPSATPTKPLRPFSISKSTENNIKAESINATIDESAVDRIKRFNTETSAAIVRDRMKKERDNREARFYENYRPMRLEEARDLRGTCMDMCPEFERYDREITQELHYFEMIKGTENDANPRCDHELAVKKYRRSAAGKDPEIFPEDIRPPPVLQKTMDYLIGTILERKDQEFVEVYNFIRDRGRALRKDFKVQNHLKGKECVYVLEKLARFLIHADFTLCELPESKYSWKQNRHQIFDTLTTLMEIYDDDSQIGTFHLNEAEFRSYYILLMLDDSVPVDRYQTWRIEVQADIRVQVAVEFHRYFQNKDYRNFFRHICHSETTYLMACLLHLSFEQVRKDGFKCLSSALMWKEKPVPISLLRALFGFDGEEAVVEYCRYLGLDVEQIDGYMGVRFGRRDSKISWIEPASQFKTQRSRIILLKLGDFTHTSVVNGILAKVSEPSCFPFNTSSITKRQLYAAETSAKKAIAAPVDVARKEDGSAKAHTAIFGSMAFPTPIFGMDKTTNNSTNIATTTTTTITASTESHPLNPIGFQAVAVARKKDYSKIATELADALVEDLVLFIADETVAAAINKFKILIRTQKDIMQLCCEEIIVMECEFAASLCLRKRMALTSVADTLQTEILEGEIHLLLSQDLIPDSKSDFYHYTSLTRRAFFGWYSLYRYRFDLRVQKEVLKRKREENLRQIPLLMPLFSGNSYHGRQMIPFSIRGLNYENAAAIGGVIERVEMLRRPLDLPHLIIRRVSDTSHHTGLPQLFKLLICTPETIDPSIKGFVEWFSGKFRIGGVATAERLILKESNIGIARSVVLPEDLCGSTISIGEKKILQVKFSCETLCFFRAQEEDTESSSWENSENLVVLVQQIVQLESSDPMQSGGNIIRNFNSSSANSGTCAVLFLTFVSQAEDVILLESEKRRLWSLIASLPRFSRPPLMIVHLHPGKNMEEILFLGLDLQRLLDYRLISTWKVANLNCIDGNSSLQASVQLLEDAVKWLATNTSPSPRLDAGIISDFLLNNCLVKFQKNCRAICEGSVQYIRKDRTQLVRLLNGAFDLFNCILRSLISISSSKSLLRIAWPASEVVNTSFSRVEWRAAFPSIDWNSQSRLHEIAARLQSNLLPSIEISRVQACDITNSHIYSAIKDFLLNVLAKHHRHISSISRPVLANLGNLLMGENITSPALVSTIEDLLIPIFYSIPKEIANVIYGIREEVKHEEQALAISMYCVINDMMEAMRKEIMQKTQIANSSSRCYSEKFDERKRTRSHTADLSLLDRYEAYNRSVSREVERTKLLGHLLRSAIGNQP